MCTIYTTFPHISKKTQEPTNTNKRNQSRGLSPQSAPHIYIISTIVTVSILSSHPRNTNHHRRCDSNTHPKQIHRTLEAEPQES